MYIYYLSLSLSLSLRSAIFNQESFFSSNSSDSFRPWQGNQPHRTSAAAWWRLVTLGAAQIPVQSFHTKAANMTKQAITALVVTAQAHCHPLVMSIFRYTNPTRRFWLRIPHLYVYVRTTPYHYITLHLIAISYCIIYHTKLSYIILYYIRVYYMRYFIFFI